MSVKYKSVENCNRYRKKRLLHQKLIVVRFPKIEKLNGLITNLSNIIWFGMQQMVCDGSGSGQNDDSYGRIRVRPKR